MNFTKPASLNGTQLKAELKADGINVDVIEDNGDGTISLLVPVTKVDAATRIVAAHVGVESQPTISEKLAIVGLTVEELKAALA
jgi:hypothetical protein